MTPTSRASTRRLVVVVAVAVQLLALAAAWGLHLRNRGLDMPASLVSQVLAPEDMVYADSDVSASRGERLPPVDVGALGRRAPDVLKRGAEAFAQRCSSCHGTRARGDGPSGLALTPRPRDLTVLVGWKGGARPSDVFTTITTGLAGTQMPGFDYLPAEERLAIASHVTSLNPGYPADTPDSLAALDRRFRLSEGAPEPSTIPLSVAAEKLVAEAAAGSEGGSSAEAGAAAEPRGAAVFARVAARHREAAAIRWLSADRSWAGDSTRLRAIVVGSYPENGFTAHVGLLSADEWAALERYLALRCAASRND